jgi:uncharacterized protein
MFRLFLLLLFPVLLNAQDSENLNEKFEMKQYYLVFLKKGPHRSQDSTTAVQIQKDHLAYLTQMYDENKMSMCGPLMQEHEIRGICIYHVESAEEARKLAEDDPAVQSGRLVVEVLPWYCAKGMVLK